MIVDDVISAGTAVGESLRLLRSAGAQPAAVLIALDRQEKAAVARAPSHAGKAPASGMPDQAMAPSNKASPACRGSSQARRRPRRGARPGSSMRSISGAHRNLNT